MGDQYLKYFAAKKAYEAYAASLLASDSHWESRPWDEVCQEPEFAEAWNQAARVAHAAIEQAISDSN